MFSSIKENAEQMIKRSKNKKVFLIYQFKLFNNKWNEKNFIEFLRNRYYIEDS